MIVCPLIRSEHDLHVLLRHRLLREADGFESLGTVRVLLAASCPFPTDEPYLPTLHSHFNSAASAPSVQDGADEHIVARVQELRRDDVEVVSGFRPALEVAAQAVVPMDRSTFLVRQVLEFLMAERQHPFYPCVFQPSKDRPNDFHVLLRHRQRSIPHAQESA